MPTRRDLILRGLAASAALPLLALAARGGPAAPSPRLAAPQSPAARPAMGQMHAVEIRGFAFVPAQIAIAPGDTVVFTNRDAAPHTVTAQSGQFDSGRLGTGQSVRMSFPSRGSYAYFCAIHPRMRGTITVG